MKKITTLALCALLTLSLLAAPAFAAGMYILDPMGSATFSADGEDGTIKYNFKDGGGAWANIMNPWGASAYMTVIPSQGSIQSLILTFEVSGYDGGADGYRAMVGFGINGWTPSIWSLDIGGDDNANWEDVFGEKYNYYIEGDGVYRMIVPMRAAMDYAERLEVNHAKDWLEGIDCIELGIFDPPESTTMRVTILDLEETSDFWSLGNMQRLTGSPLYASVGDLPSLPEPEAPRVPAEPEPEAPAPEEPSPGGEEPPAPVETPDVTPDPTPEEPSPAPPSSDDDEGGIGWWLWVALGGAAIAIVCAVIATKKKK
ncbi:MAG: hypothetical protein LBI19_10185 [Oscillospiraceae bacterium]|jgi:hypothetical protein|nr:hypothetical protein [Oscillospiraceae bacterium]